MVWARDDNGWRGVPQKRPSIHYVFNNGRKLLAENAATFNSLFFSTYPEYDAGNLISCGGFGMQIGHDKAHILSEALFCLWNRLGTFDCKEASVGVIVDEFGEFVDSPKVRVRFQSQLLNYHMAAPSIRLADSLSIRRLSEQEISEFNNQRRNDFHGIHEFIIEGELDAIKSLSGSLEPADNLPVTARFQLDNVLRCLRTFKEGYVGTGELYFKFVKFCPLMLGSYGFFNHFILPGIYQVSSEEIEKLQNHAQHIFKLSEPAMETACARLADAETRIRPQDQILDAVIGMESILLAGLREEGRRGELKYRFSMNYSTLFKGAKERWRAYNVAKDLYDLRSTIAHGGEVSNSNNRVGEERLNLHETAKRAKNALRFLIQHFLPQSKSHPYKNPKFWEQAYFNISEKDI